LDKIKSQSKLLQQKKLAKSEMENFDAENITIPRLIMRLKKSAYPGLTDVYDELIKKGEIC
jgi:hypothetical protein